MGGLIALLLALDPTSGPTDGVCRWRSDSAALSLTVSPSDSEKHDVDVRRVPIEFWLDENSKSTTLAAHALVLDPVRFEATRPAGDFELFSVRPELVAKAVSVVSGSAFHVRGRAGANIAGDIDIGDNPKDWVRVVGVTLPCSRVSLSPPERYLDDGAVPVSGGPGTLKWMPRSRTLKIRATPTARPSAVIQMAERSNVPLNELAVEGDQIHVDRWFYGGSRIDGWVKRSDLVPWPTGKPAGVFGGRVARPSGSCPTPTWSYRGRVKIAPGTPILTRPGGPPWGTVVDDRPIEVSLRADDAWAQITYVKGFYLRSDTTPWNCDEDLDFAWIRRDAVTMLPPEPPLESAGATMTRGAPMPTPRRLHTATLLGDGRVAVIGGELRDVRVPTLELYDPKKDRWSSGPSMNIARSGHTATLLRDGTVLVLGGCEDAHGEIFDPTKNAWRMTKSAAWPWKGHTATLLGDGTVLVVANEVDGRTPSHRTSIYDPQHDTWRDAGSLEASRSSHSATRLQDGRVLIAGGFETNTGTEYFSGRDAQSEIYDPATGRWSRAAALPRAREGHAATLLGDGRVLATGGIEDTGQDYSVITGDALIFNPRANTWRAEGTIDPEANRFARTHVRPERGPAITRCNHDLITLADGRVLLMGGDTDGMRGIDAERNPIATRILLYDPATALWTYAGDLGTQRALHTTTVLPDGAVLIVGGETTRGSARTAQEEANRGPGAYYGKRKPPDGAVLRYHPPPRSVPEVAR